MFEGVEPNPGRQGSTRQGWRKINVRAVIYELREAHPKASRDRIIGLLYEQLQAEEDVGMSACDWLVALCEDAWRSNKERAEQTLVAEKEVAAKVEVIREQFLLLNWQMPNGKRLRFCDGNYVASLGGGLARAGKKAGRKLMGEVFDEKDLRKYVTL